MQSRHYAYKLLLSMLIPGYPIYARQRDGTYSATLHNAFSYVLDLGIASYLFSLYTDRRPLRRDCLPACQIRLVVGLRVGLYTRRPPH